jgi:hypothetical protein
MASYDFSFTVYAKYWPTDKKELAVLIQAAKTILERANIDTKRIKVNITTLYNPERIVIDIQDADSVLTDLDHNAMAAELGINI